ncbi:hypothetical protein HYDPIDRAFT_109720 [Hydnomerulius pinastri MD-312]|nr:hypothetical protein HYDPIDRAFT_109720 [Hydnomerulius pinastri MD-312]
MLPRASIRRIPPLTESPKHTKIPGSSCTIVSVPSEILLQIFDTVLLFKRGTSQTFCEPSLDLLWVDQTSLVPLVMSLPSEFLEIKDRTVCASCWHSRRTSLGEASILQSTHEDPGYRPRFQIPLAVTEL